MTTTKADFDFAALDGRWHVVHSTLKLWKTGGRTNPSITYTERKTEPNGTAVWRDEVNYLVPKGSGYKAKSIVGWDRQKSKGSSYFVWRGVGMLCWVTCPCDVLFMQDDWMVMYFSKTLFTEEGIDILSRKNENLPDEVINGIRERLKNEFPKFSAVIEKQVVKPTKKDLKAAA